MTQNFRDGNIYGELVVSWLYFYFPDFVFIFIFPTYVQEPLRGIRRIWPIKLIQCDTFISTGKLQTTSFLDVILSLENIVD